MNWKYAFATLIVLVGHDFACSQQIPSTTTAAELWNPWTWFWPYAIASAEGFRDYYAKAQKATNELYQQVYKTNAFPWITGNWGVNPSPNEQGGNNGQQEGSGDQQGGNNGQQGGNGGQQGGNGGQQGGNNGQQGGNNGQQGQPNQQGNGEQTNQESNGQQTNQEESGDQTAQGNNAQTEQPVQENQDSESGAQIQGNVNDDGTGNAEINGKA